MSEIGQSGGDSPSASVVRLLERGVCIPNPWAVEIGGEVVPERIAPGVKIHAGSRLSGAGLSIGPGCRIGGESPAAVEDCQIGHGVALAGGYFAGAVFLDGASMGSGAHVRAGTLVEEQAGGAHAVGLKQTLLLPFVTLGSLINFCDCLMAGGTSRKDHSEVGSSYIHFNYTPRQDKATPSLIGDVPRGVMLDRPAIFLGGQGGLVGPTRIEYGTVIPAGIVWREDVTTPCRLVSTPERRGGGEPRAFDPKRYGDVARLVRNNLDYIGNLLALREWYRHVRPLWMRADEYRRACLEGAGRVLETVLEERIRRLGEVAGRMRDSIERCAAQPGREAARASQERLADRWPRIEAALRAPVEASAESRDVFLEALHPEGGYIEGIRALPGEVKEAGTRWLRGIVERSTQLWKEE